MTETANSYMIGGDHYKKTSIEPWEIIEAYELDYFEGNALKYLLRYRQKNGLQDLQKAQHYLAKVLERYTAELE